MAEEETGQTNETASKWIFYDPSNWESFDAFLKAYPPNQTGSSERPKNPTEQIDERTEPVWIYVGNPHATIEEGDVEMAKSLWTDKMNDPKFNPSYKFIKGIAEKTGVKMGKWNMEKIRFDKVNHYWNLIARATRDGKLGVAAKVTTRFAAASKGYSIHVFTKNFMDEKDWMRVEYQLRSLSIVEKLKYRPELYTHLGIYNDCIHLGIKSFLKQTGIRKEEEEDVLGKLPSDDRRETNRNVLAAKQVRISHTYGTPLDPMFRSHMQFGVEGYPIASTSRGEKPKSALAKDRKVPSTSANQTKDRKS